MINSEVLRPMNSGRKALGKLANRLEEVKNPWRYSSTLELSHNEAARLATDALLESGEKEYRRVLAEERELNFLSSLEIKFITENVAKNNFSSAVCGNGSEIGEGDAVSELTSGTYFPMMSDEEPPMLELGWPQHPDRYGPSETQIYFQRDKSHNVKDLIRSVISKAKKVIALVMDVFTDVDLFCDLMEASEKRRVPVYILLDEKNLHYFIEMCKALEVDSSHLTNMRIRSVCGETYCTKSGKKFTGQVQEKFLIVDCEEVIAGSYSFTWLSALVHSNMVLHFSGRVSETFDREFRCLYADSQIISYFDDPEEEEGLRYYPLSNLASSTGLDMLVSRERDYSENSSSQSSSSVSSIKKAPGMSSHINKFEQEKKQTGPEWRAAQNQGAWVSTNSPGQNPVVDHGVSGVGQTEWYKAAAPDSLTVTVGGTTSKLQGLGIYDHKPTYHGTPRSPPRLDVKVTNRNSRNQAHPILNKISDFFSASGKEKSPPQSMAFGGPDLSQAEPESKQTLPPPPIPPTDGPFMGHRITRNDNGRMTLGHSKLDLVNHYNKMKTKNIYSRFELKNNNPG
ncbi:protein FAM83C isoform X1 [Brienomyrus brachyistius]|uniref:protein FAM83C isoform X1 n=1 Tax=Brienomyrus brachyistius TaxID=42636 RepID=UPI0020B1DAC4|nr:protein FAM83C isoform X1 [Brienomyrus brachyistius]